MGKDGFELNFEKIENDGSLVFYLRNDVRAAVKAESDTKVHVTLWLAGDELKTLTPKTFRSARNQIHYKTEPGRCTSCSKRSRCTNNKTGRQVLRHRDERYVDRVKSYRGTFAYEKALRKRRVWVEPLFGEAKDWHGYAPSGSGCYRR